MARHPNSNSNTIFTKLLESSNSETKILYQAEVIDIQDPLNAGRIKVYLPKIDSTRQNLPWAHSLLPTHLQILPSVGERVIIILENPWDKFHGRYWIGPVFSADVVTDEGFEESLKKSGL